MNPKLSRAKRLLKWTQKPTKDRRKHPRSPSLALKDMGLGKILIPCTKHGCTPMHWVYAYIGLIVMPSMGMTCLALPCWACHAQLVLGMHLSTLLGVLPSTQGAEHAP